MSFIEAARRRQIIDATIGVLAHHGYAKASLSRIADEAGISKSIISYHFAGKDELFEQVFLAVAERAGEAMTPHMAVARSPAESIAAYIRHQIGYMHAHREELIAIGVLAVNHGGPEGPDYIARMGQEELDLLATFFHEGQQKGQFRAFDTGFMAATLSKAIEGVLEQWAWKPETDLDACAEELIALFLRGIARREDD